MIAALRDWAAQYNARGRYSPVGQTFHWTMAALISFQLYWGWHMGQLPAGADKLRGYQIHAEIGLLMLVMASMRFVWRLIVPGPINDADRLGWWQTMASYATHMLFYACFFGLPLTGWAMWSALGDSPPLSIAGLVAWPDMPFHTAPTAIQWFVLHGAETLHWLLVMLLLVMVPLHVGAALKHHFWDRHDVLLGMLPELPEDEPLAAPPHDAKPREVDPVPAGG